MSCGTPNTQRPRERETVTRSFLKVTEGMEQEQVLQLLGPPSEVRAGIPSTQKFHHDVTTHKFAYGVRSPGGFAEIGLISFDASNRVRQAVSPTRGYGIRLGASELPSRLDIPHPTSNVLCIIKGVTYDPEGPDAVFHYRVKFELINESKAVRFIPNWQPSLSRCMVIEVYDEHERLFFRKDEGTLGQVIVSASNDYFKLRLEPGSSLKGENYIWLSVPDFGQPPPGKYYIRVAYGFRPNAQAPEEFTVSKAVRFNVQ
jgi:hypothetical protein